MDLRILRCLSELHDVIGIRDGWIMVHGCHGILYQNQKTSLIPVQDVIVEYHSRSRIFGQISAGADFDKIKFISLQQSSKFGEFNSQLDRSTGIHQCIPETNVFRALHFQQLSSLFVFCQVCFHSFHPIDFVFQYH